MEIEGNSREKKSLTAIKELDQQRKENRKKRMNLTIENGKQQKTKQTENMEKDTKEKSFKC